MDAIVDQLVLGRFLADLGKFFADLGSFLALALSASWGRDFQFGVQKLVLKS